jgi:hypothetical protein
MERTTVIIGAALFAATTTASAQGYFSFGEIPGVDRAPTVQIDLNPTMLAFVNAAAKGAGTLSDDAAAAAAALEGVTNVRVYVYEHIGNDLPAVMKFVADSSAALERDGWQRVVRVNEDGEQVHVYMKPSTDAAAPAGSLAGLTVMVTDEGAGDEAVFINVAGTIEPAQLGRIAGSIGMNGVFNGVPGLQITPSQGSAE